jgi:hypothetical protein
MVEGGPIFNYVQQFNYVQPLVIGIVECCGIVVEWWLKEGRFSTMFLYVQLCSTIGYSNCRMLWNSGGMVVEGGPIFDYVQQFNYVQPLVIGIVECC